MKDSNEILYSKEKIKIDKLINLSPEALDSSERIAINKLINLSPSEIDHVNNLSTISSPDSGKVEGVSYLQVLVKNNAENKR
jgi:hypothetical protein